MCCYVYMILFNIILNSEMKKKKVFERNECSSLIIKKERDTLI